MNDIAALIVTFALVVSAIGVLGGLAYWVQQRRVPREEFTEVPITTGFDTTLPILGTVRILTSALPPTPDFVFALGFMAEKSMEQEPGVIPTEPYRGQYRLVSVAMVTDDKYLAYLRQIGVGGER